MPTIFFVRDGTGDHQTSTGKSVSLTDIEQLAVRFPPHYRNGPPQVNAGVASAFAPYRHVVIEVESHETSPTFSRTGYYLLAGMSPRDAFELLGVSPE